MRVLGWCRTYCKLISTNIKELKADIKAKQPWISMTFCVNLLIFIDNIIMRKTENIYHSWNFRSVCFVQEIYIKTYKRLYKNSTLLFYILSDQSFVRVNHKKLMSFAMMAISLTLNFEKKLMRFAMMAISLALNFH